MKIKELFKKVEIANEVFEITRRSGEIFQIVLDYFDNFCYYKFTTYKQFKKKVKDEFVPDFAKALIETDFELGKAFYINDSKCTFDVELKE